MTAGRIRIDDRISYWKSTKDPLSADIGVVEGDAFTWIFDVGSSDEAAWSVQSIPMQKNIVLSHFHKDHIGNLGRIDCQKIYQGTHTFRYTHKGEVVRGNQCIRDGVILHLFECPSSHAKGTIGLEIDGKYAFLGDALYCTMKEGKSAYNANLLAEEIRVLRDLHAEYFLISHDENFVQRKEEVLARLESIYKQRNTKSAYIFLEEPK